MSNSYNGYQEKRPKIKIPYSNFEKIVEIIALAGILINIILLIKYWPQLPSTIPTHFGYSGKADGWGSKGTLFLLPIFIIVIYFGLTLLTRIPHTFNYVVPITEKNAVVQYQIARKMINCLKAEVIFIFTFIQWEAITAGMGGSSGLGLGFLPISMIIVFGTLGYYIYRSVKLKY